MKKLEAINRAMDAIRMIVNEQSDCDVYVVTQDQIAAVKEFATSRYLSEFRSFCQSIWDGRTHAIRTVPVERYKTKEEANARAASLEREGKRVELIA